MALREELLRLRIKWRNLFCSCSHLLTVVTNFEADPKMLLCDIINLEEEIENNFEEIEMCCEEVEDFLYDSIEKDLDVANFIKSSLQLFEYYENLVEQNKKIHTKQLQDYNKLLQP